MPSEPTISRWLWIFSGFLQSMKAANGSEMIWRSARRLATADMCVQLRDFCSDPKTVAGFIARNSPDLTPPRVVLAGYSWGGDCAVDVAKVLGEHGYPVEELVLGDGVFRGGFLEFGDLRVPDTVQRVTAFVQRTDHPRGSKILYRGGELAPVVLPYGHAGIDDSAEYADAVIAAAQRLAA